MPNCSSGVLTHALGAEMGARPPHGPMDAVCRIGALDARIGVKDQGLAASAVRPPHRADGSWRHPREHRRSFARSGRADNRYGLARL